MHGVMAVGTFAGAVAVAAYLPPYRALITFGSAVHIVPSLEATDVSASPELMLRVVRHPTHALFAGVARE